LRETACYSELWSYPELNTCMPLSLPLSQMPSSLLLLRLLLLPLLLLPQDLHTRHLLRPASTASTVRSTVCPCFCIPAPLIVRLEAGVPRLSWGVDAHAFHITRRELLRAIVPAGKGLTRGKSAVTQST
jgi:hypothetical protein